MEVTPQILIGATRYVEMGGTWAGLNVMTEMFNQEMDVVIYAQLSQDIRAKAEVRSVLTFAPLFVEMVLELAQNNVTIKTSQGGAVQLAKYNLAGSVLAATLYILIHALKNVEQELGE